MTKLISYLLITLSLSVNAGQWVIHGFKDNYLQVMLGSEMTYLQCGETWTGGMGYVSEAMWDYQFDIDFPEWASSGSQSGALQCDGMYLPEFSLGYQDTQTLTFPSGEFNAPIALGGGTSLCYVSGGISQGSPGYNGHQDFQFPTIPGEYWIDFASDSTVRISTAQPADFGKWAWDGSINPSWVEPEAIPLQHGKKLGHNK